MIVHDYTPFVGQGTTLLLDTGQTIHAVQLDQPEQVGAGQALMLARDVHAWEIILNAETWRTDHPSVYCPTCDGDGCNDCRQRGYVVLDSVRALIVLTAEDRTVTATRIKLNVDDCGVHLGDTDCDAGLEGPLVDRLRDIVTRPHHTVHIAEMLLAWEAQGLGKVLR